MFARDLCRCRERLPLQGTFAVTGNVCRYPERLPLPGCISYFYFSQTTHKNFGVFLYACRRPTTGAFAYFFLPPTMFFVSFCKSVVDHPPKSVSVFDNFVLDRPQIVFNIVCIVLVDQMRNYSCGWPWANIQKYTKKSFWWSVKTYRIRNHSCGRFRKNRAKNAIDFMDILRKQTKYSKLVLWDSLPLPGTFAVTWNVCRYPERLPLPGKIWWTYK